jgi:hypothetical protein
MLRSFSVPLFIPIVYSFFFFAIVTITAHFHNRVYCQVSILYLNLEIFYLLFFHTHRHRICIRSFFTCSGSTFARTTYASTYDAAQLFCSSCYTCFLFFPPFRDVLQSQNTVTIVYCARFESSTSTKMFSTCYSFALTDIADVLESWQRFRLIFARTTWVSRHVYLSPFFKLCCFTVLRHQPHPCHLQEVFSVS